MSQRRFWAAANWKLNKSPREAEDFVKALAASEPSKCQLAIYPQNFSCSAVSLGATAGKYIWGAQNCHWETSGALTGENSVSVLKEMGAKTVLIGHSERRQLFGETDSDIAKKVQAAQNADLLPLLCVGEELETRKSGKTRDHVLNQISAGLAQASFENPFAIAYEPVWAIGTGEVATPEMANEVHIWIREHLAEMASPAIADSTSLLYGGSVKPGNALELGKMSDVDGFLIGGASLEPTSFLEIAKALDSAKNS